jgi:hypothetical protein
MKCRSWQTKNELSGPGKKSKHAGKGYIMPERAWRECGGRLSQERNLRGDWFFDWQDEKKKFELFFDAMCYRWKLYGMEQDKPLLAEGQCKPHSSRHDDLHSPTLELRPQARPALEQDQRSSSRLMAQSGKVRN